MQYNNNTVYCSIIKKQYNMNKKLFLSELADLFNKFNASMELESGNYGEGEDCAYLTFKVGNETVAEFREREEGEYTGEARSINADNLFA